MKLISVEKYIQNIKQNLHLLPKNYYSKRFHRDYIKALSLKEYGKWLEYLKERELERNRIYRQTHREQIREREKNIYKTNLTGKEKTRNILNGKNEILIDIKNTTRTQNKREKKLG